MNRFRFLHTADLHLDSPFRGMAHVPSAVRESIRESTFAAFGNVIELAIREQVDFVLVSGDVYDLADRSLRAQLRFQRGMERLAASGIQAFVVCGNHDPESGTRAQLAWPSTVHFFGSGEAEERIACRKDGTPLARVYGISYPTAAVTDNLAQRIRDKAGAADGSLYRIGLLHANATGDPNHDNYAPCTKQELAASKIDYWALGHIHTRMVVHNEPWIVYPGNTQGRSVRETGAKGCYIADVYESGRTELTFHATDDIRWFHEEMPIEDLVTEQALKNALEERLVRVKESAEGRSAVVRLTLTGRGDLHERLRQPAFLQELASAHREEQAVLRETDGRAPFVWLESITAKTGYLLDLDELLEQDSFIGELLREARRTAAPDEPERLRGLVETAMDGLMQQPKANKFLPVPGAEEYREWLDEAAEIAVGLLLGGGGAER